MNRYRNVIGMAGLGLLVLLLAAGALSAQTKIRVKDPNAVIRIKPDDKAEIVQDKLGVGTVYTVERKTSDWYEIKYRASGGGFLFSGFIHQSQVEDADAAAPVQTTPSAPPRKAAVQEVRYAPQPRTGLEISLFGGLGMPQVNGTANYNWAWSGILFDADENTNITTKSKSSAFFGGGINYFFTPIIGVGLNVGFLKSGLTTTSDFSFTYGPYTKNASWTGTDNSFSSVPISLDIIARFGSSRIQGYVQAGPTLFMNSANIDAAIGYGYSFVYYIFPNYYEFYEAVKVPMDAYDKTGGAGTTSWTGIGGNAGAGVTFMISPSFGLSLGAQYFFCPKREFGWTLHPGTYTGLFVTNPSTSLTVTPSDIDLIFSGNHLSTITINPSFFQITAGIKIKL